MATLQKILRKFYDADTPLTPNIFFLSHFLSADLMSNPSVSLCTVIIVTARGRLLEHTQTYYYMVPSWHIS